VHPTPASFRTKSFIFRAVRPLGIGAETHLNGSQYGQFSRSVLSVDEIDVSTQLNGELVMTHKVFHGDFVDDAGFGGLLETVMFYHWPTIT
jgi:hypothetical protein